MNGGATQRNIKKRVKRQPLLPILNINYPRGGKTHVPYPTAYEPMLLNINLSEYSLDEINFEGILIQRVKINPYHEQYSKNAAQLR